MRFRNLAPEERSPEQQRLAEKLSASPRGSVRGPYIPLQHSPDLADRMRHLGDFIRFGGEIAPKLKEMLILINARHWSMDYMFAVHRDFAHAAGVEQAIIDAIAQGERPAGLDPAESVAVDLAQELLRDCRVSDARFAATREKFGEKGTIELISFIGYYTMLAMILNASEMPVPSGAQSLPSLARESDQ
jgi:4-carboxymuconolactone decarboxylase